MSSVSAEKDRVLTLNDWWDGPRLGLATFRGGYCIFERVFSEELDDYTDRYWLTPVDETTARAVLDDWANWVAWMAPFPNSSDRALAWQKTGNPLSLADLAAQMPEYRRESRKGLFSGTVRDLVSPVEDCFVVWQ